MTGDERHDATAELNEALAAGFAAGNCDGLADFYTEDASILPPRGQQLRGRATVGPFWLGVSRRFSSVVFTTGDLKALGDAARRETGTYTMRSADGQSVEGKYVFVWQSIDGEWQIESSIWNRNGEAGAGRRQGQGAGRGGLRAGQGGGYRQAGNRPSFQGGRGQGGGRQAGPGQRGAGQENAGGPAYDGGDGGLYSGPQT